jgi:formylglycine-generating enzyme
MIMKKYKLILLLMVGAAVLSCSQQSSSTGELTGAAGRGKWFEPVPFGMTFIRRGSFAIGPSDEDPTSGIAPTKNVTIDAFWMDDTEITNNEYRQFTNYVKDSIARCILFDSQNQDASLYRNLDPAGNPTTLNWRQKIDWRDTSSLLDQGGTSIPFGGFLYMEVGNRFNPTSIEIDAHRLIYSYSRIDYQKAAQRTYSYDYQNQQYINNSSRHDLFVSKKDIPVYPDTLCWIRDFTYAFNEPWTLKYFWHPGFDEYPVVGVNWEQATAFCKWRSQQQDEFFSKTGSATVQEYRLPTEFEWEYAARGGLINSKYPWGGYYSRNQQGYFMANFKPLRGNYSEDGGLMSMKVGSFLPNDYGLYDMSGNVAEWTSTAYDELVLALISELNPDFKYDAKLTDPPAMKRKVIRGGSWKDVSAYISVSSRTYEYLDTSRAFIGFRCVRSSFGNDF